MDRSGSGKENGKEMDLNAETGQLSYELQGCARDVTYGEIDDKRFSKRINGSDGGVGGAGIA